MKLKQIIKEWFTREPKKSIWFHLCYILIIYRYAAPAVFKHMIFLTLGIQAPEIDPMPAIEKASTTMAEAFGNSMLTLFEAGQRIGTNSPLAGNLIVILYYSFVYGLYISMIYMAVEILRLILLWVYKKINKSLQRVPKQ